MFPFTLDATFKTHLLGSCTRFVHLALLIVQTSETEEMLSRDISLVCCAYAVAGSKWNQSRGANRALFLIRENTSWLSPAEAEEAGLEEQNANEEKESPEESLVCIILTLRSYQYRPIDPKLTQSSKSLENGIHPLVARLQAEVPPPKVINPPLPPQPHKKLHHKMYGVLCDCCVS